MRILQTLLPLLLALLPLTTAQGVLTNGNSQFPSCATSCQLLNQAAQACGGASSADAGIWSCFCQSGYLKSLYTSPNGICDAVCTSASDNQQVMKWYKSNCGSDNGQSEHANGGSGGGGSASSTVAGATSSTANVGTVLPSNTAASGQVVGTDDGARGYTGSWWSAHYKWIIMLIVIFFALLIIALVAVLLKRRHDRRQDQIRGGFNAGITHRTAGPPPPAPSGYTSGSNPQLPFNPDTASANGNGRSSPARTRDAFMPYGYAYARSESRLGSAQPYDGMERTGSPLAKGGMLASEIEMQEKEMDGSRSRSRGKKGRVLVRERDADEIEVEKRGMR